MSTTPQTHPFGDPQTVTVDAAGSTVTVHWEVGGLDDLTVLGVDLGVLPEDRVLLDGAILPEDDDPATVGESDEFADYLLDRIAVTSDGEDCAGEVAEVGDEGGADVEFTCAAPVTSAEVTVRTLTDLHPAYRTLASGPDGQRAVYGSDAETHTWTFDPTAATSTTPRPAPADDDLGQSAAVQLTAVLAGIVLLVVIATLVLRRRSTADHPTP